MRTFGYILAVFVAVFLVIVLVAVALARDDGRWKGMDPALHRWFESLASGKGPCCSFADGQQIDNVDWDTLGGTGEGGNNNCTSDIGCGNGRYRVHLYGKWIVVPDTAVITQPNKAGIPVVWPYIDADATIQIRCFLPGPGA